MEHHKRGTTRRTNYFMQKKKVESILWSRAVIGVKPMKKSEEETRTMRKIDETG